MLWFILAALVIVASTVYAFASSSSDERFENTFFTFISTLLGSGIFLVAAGNAIASAFSGNYTLTTTTQELEEFSDGKYVILGGDGYTFRTEDGVRTESKYLTTITEGDKAVVRVGKYEPNFMTTLGKDTIYVLVVPEDGIDF